MENNYNNDNKSDGEIDINNCKYFSELGNMDDFHQNSEFIPNL